ncbi:ubiquinone anaerobic biosynthesis accessory factor UbiT [Azospira restricta]|uniref:Ubiquinone biosynthesis accessory factor UbiT n=1 Tax=Azospira restricta TaxID=404405 RepID=A0A974SPT1_9RHOO|nr:SCP2 sterol-binding domain-containing protein [Azospira restricta]QRJ64253.1 SCP2 sterol-binding domain-containing protein [Azospira restricta]
MDQGFTIPKFQLPGFIARIGEKLPQWPHAVALTTALNAAAKLGLLPEDSLAAMEGKTFVVQVYDTGGQAAFTYRGGFFRPLFRPAGTPDLAFRANLSAFLQVATRQEDPDTLFFNRELSIEGDTELGLIVKNMLDAIDLSQLKPRLPQLPRSLPFISQR